MAKEFKKEAKPVFVKEFPTVSKTYKPGDTCEFTEPEVLEYLLTNKFIK